jgi:hypothetical protein
VHAHHCLTQRGQHAAQHHVAPLLVPGVQAQQGVQVVHQQQVGRATRQRMQQRGVAQQVRPCNTGCRLSLTATVPSNRLGACMLATRAVKNRNLPAYPPVARYLTRTRCQAGSPIVTPVGSTGGLCSSFFLPDNNRTQEFDVMCSRQQRMLAIAAKESRSKTQSSLLHTFGTGAIHPCPPALQPVLHGRASWSCRCGRGR